MREKGATTITYKCAFQIITFLNVTTIIAVRRGGGVKARIYTCTHNLISISLERSRAHNEQTLF